jgi:3-oxoacid CoA-transferase subunit A
VFRKTARNFNPMMATAAKVTIAEVEEFVSPGELDPDMIHTPGIFVQRVVKATQYDKPIEQRTITER